ncbi:cytidylate kinase family protein, partial [Candidatus Woesearchaeota archaeon]|nr:cytidylate kinase family protein [Candidatus Woesearchaeota archaeon]
DSLKVFIEVDIGKAAQRIFNAKREDEHGESVEEIRKVLERRIKSERLRYKKYYNIDIDNLGNYDLVVDSSNISAEKVADKIVGHVKKV